VLGLLVAALLGWLLARGMLRLDLRRFFTWTGAFLIIVAAGVLAYAVHDLQEGGVLPGPFGALAPVDPPTGAVAVGIVGFPFGWAFELTAQIPPGSALAAVLQATIGFTPQMSWRQVIAWALYIAVVGAFFVGGAFRSRRPAARGATVPAASEPVTAPAAPTFAPVAPAAVDAPDSLPQGAA
jgi:high-affinity iron transporter